LGRLLAGRATAAMDVSDGLLGDLAKLAQASGVRAQVELGRLPIAPTLAAHHAPADCERLVLQGGDDYELLFTLPPGEATYAESIAAEAGCPLHTIGTIEAGSGVVCTREGRPEPVPVAGFDHFPRA
jgi:thiamine-monophosphate kinase